MLSNMPGDGEYLDCGHRLALKPACANQGDQHVYAQ